MLQPLLLQGLAGNGHVLQGLQQLNAGLSTLQQDHTLPVGLLLLHQHLQVEEQEEEEVDRKGRDKRLERLERPMNRSARLSYSLFRSCRLFMFQVSKHQVQDISLIGHRLINTHIDAGH